MALPSIELGLLPVHYVKFCYLGIPSAPLVERGRLFALFNGAELV